MTAPGTLPTRPAAPRPPLRVAVVGCGAIGPRHVAAYAGTGRARLVGVADIVPERARLVAAEAGDVTAYPDLTALLADQQPDLVSIATPPGTHADLAVEALRAGTTVLLEKPPCPTLAELDRVAAAEASSTARAYVVFQHRHGSGARRAKRLIDSGAAGRAYLGLCETLWYRPDSYFDPDWRGTWSGEGGGPTLGHGIHQIDLFCHLLGPWDRVDAVTARLARPVEFEDVSLATVVLANGAVGSVVNSLLSADELSRIRIDLAGGSLEVDHVYGYTDADWSFRPTPDAERAATLGRDPGVPGAGGTAGRTAKPEDWWPPVDGPEVPSNHDAQIARLVEDLLAGREHETTLASTRPTMELVTGLYASALTGSPVRRGELVPGHPFYADLSGGLTAAEVTARMVPGAAQPPA